MPKKKNKNTMKKYVKVLDKFGLLPPFEFSKKEKKIVKYLSNNGATDALTLGEMLDLKPDKTNLLVEELIQKGAIERDTSGLLALTLTATNYLHSKKTIKKSAKKFCKFVDAMDEKELDEFMNLVNHFEVAPEVPPIEEEIPVAAPVEAPSIEEPKEEPKEEAPAEEPVKEELPVEKPAPKPRPRRRRKATPKKVPQKPAKPR